jgi:hypothetical protein
MSRSSLARLHLAAAAGAIAAITTFLAASAVTELAGDPGDIRVLQRGILLGLPLLIGFLVTAALTGRRLAGRSRSAVVRRKRRRLRAAAAAGLLVLVPCALILDQLASAPTGPVFAALEIAELSFGALNPVSAGAELPRWAPHDPAAHDQEARVTRAQATGGD